MKILILNWRSLKDPLAGGAEVATFEHAKRWVKNHNAEVIWLSPKYNKTIQEETIEGVKFKYIGLPLTRKLSSLIFTYPLFFLLVIYTYYKNYRGRIDIVIDQVHGFPYLTPFYVKEKVVVHVNEIAGDIWNKMYKFPINKIGLLLENLIFKPYIWKNIKFVAISEGTKSDLMRIGIREENISVIYCGINSPIIDKPKDKEERFTIIFLNRLVKMKGIERAIDIVAETMKKRDDLQFWIIGKGEDQYVNFLNTKIKNLQLEKNTTFWGFVSQEKKHELLTRAHVLLNTSYKEGWGLVNIEANSRGTPAVGFNVRGNSESIREGESGLLCKNDDNLTISKLLLKTKENRELQLSSIKFSKQFSWEIQSNIYFNVLK